MSRRQVTINPSVFALLHCLDAMNGSADQADDVRRWGSAVFEADWARARYIAETGFADEPFTPVDPAAGSRHTTFSSGAGRITAEMTRQAAAADRLEAGHNRAASQAAAQADALEQQAAACDAGEGDDEAAASSAREAAACRAQAEEARAAAAAQHAAAALAGVWYDRAHFAASEGDALVATYNVRYHDLNRAAQDAAGDAAEAPSYAQVA